METRPSARLTPSTPASPRAGDPGPLAGIPIGVKDLQNARGYVTTYGSALHADDPPASADDPFVARMRDAGCIILGKTNTPEFGWMGNTTNALFGPSYNPFDLSRGPGGSSGGSSAALAAGMVPLATGSDGGGSIRIPSACCGLSGMKPSLGRVPAGGPNPPGWIDLSTNGPMARRIADVTLALDVAVGPDPTDLRALPRPRSQLDRRPRRPARAGQNRLLPDARLRHCRRRGGRRLRSRRRATRLTGRRCHRRGFRFR